MGEEAEELRRLVGAARADELVAEPVEDPKLLATTLVYEYGQTRAYRIAVLLAQLPQTGGRHGEVLELLARRRPWWRRLRRRP